MICSFPFSNSSNSTTTSQFLWVNAAILRIKQWGNEHLKSNSFIWLLKLQTNFLFIVTSLTIQKDIKTKSIQRYITHLSPNPATWGLFTFCWCLSFQAFLCIFTNTYIHLEKYSFIFYKGGMILYTCP